MTPPISYTHNNHATYLKWHRARRTSTDPVFTRTRILEAMTYGASLEVDLRIHASSGCAILHNTTLDSETTGGGAVREAPASYLRTLFLRDNDGNATSEPLLLLEDLVDTLLLKKQQGEIHPNAVLQLDFKDDVSALSDESLARIASILKPVATHMILSGGDFAAIRRLGSMVPRLRLGFDPCLGPLAAKLRADGDFGAFVESALNEAPEAEMLYLYFEVVMRADRVGSDVIQRVHGAGKRVDVWTVRRVDGESLAMVRRLLELGVDQITTDDAEGLAKALEE